MTTAQMIDYNHLEPRHHEIDGRLTNWGRWAKVRPRPWGIMPMWRNAKTPRPHEDDLVVPLPIDELDALLIEKAVAVLPDKRRTLIRWMYVFSFVPESVVRRDVAMTRQAAFDESRKAMDMLKNTCASQKSGIVRP